MLKLLQKLSPENFEMVLNYFFKYFRNVIEYTLHKDAHVDVLNLFSTGYAP